MTDLELATILAVHTTAEIGALLPRLAIEGRAIWFTTAGGVSTFIAGGRAASSDHSPAEAAHLWGVGILDGDRSGLTPAAQDFRAGVVGSAIDPFIINGVKQ